MAAFLALCGAATLLGQPAAFWRHPELATRWDGLSIHAATNPSFEFFLGHGWDTYVAVYLLYALAVFAVVSILPARLSLFAAFTAVFGHFNGLSNWLGVRWHLGLQGALIVAVPLAFAVMFCVMSSAPSAANARRVRWLAAAALFGDLTATLIGQPHGYWLNPHVVHEANSVSRYFLEHGWALYMLYDIVLAAGLVVFVGALPPASGFAIALIFVFAGFAGVSNWFFYEWRWGIAACVLYGALLSAILTMMLGWQPRVTEQLAPP